MLGNRSQILGLRPSGPHFTEEEPETQRHLLVTEQAGGTQSHNPGLLASNKTCLMYAALSLSY